MKKAITRTGICIVLALVMVMLLGTSAMAAEIPVSTDAPITIQPHFDVDLGQEHIMNIVINAIETQGLISIEEMDDIVSWIQTQTPESENVYRIVHGMMYLATFQRDGYTDYVIYGFTEVCDDGWLRGGYCYKLVTPVSIYR